MNRLKSIRKAKGITQRELAISLGVTDSAVSQWEREDGKIPMGQIQRIANLLDVSTQELIEPEPSYASAHRRPDGVLSGISSSSCPFMDLEDGKLDLSQVEKAGKMVSSLESLTQLYTDGYLTPEEFSKAKGRILT